MHNHSKTTKDQQKKPSALTMYDYTKGGVDVVDIFSTTNLTRIKSRRWPMNALTFILGTCHSNAKTIFKMKIQQIKCIEDNCNQ